MLLTLRVVLALLIIRAVLMLVRGVIQGASGEPGQPRRLAVASCCEIRSAVSRDARQSHHGTQRSRDGVLLFRKMPPGLD
jgi:hypothetical protein